MRLFRALPRLAGLALVVMGCRTVRPSSLAQWSACLAELDFASYLELRATWNDVPFSSEHEEAVLHVELPRPLAEGAEIRFSGGKPPASYREGSEGLHFDSDTFEGSIRVVRLRASSVELAVDLRAVSPNVDVEKRGAIPFRGIITVPRSPRDAGCR